MTPSPIKKNDPVADTNNDLVANKINDLGAFAKKIDPVANETKNHEHATSVNQMRQNTNFELDAFCDSVALKINDLVDHKMEDLGAIA